MYLSAAILCSKVIGLIGAIGLGFLIIAGAIISRAEENYWREFWTGTPSTEGASDPAATDTATSEIHSLRKAA